MDLNLENSILDTFSILSKSSSFPFLFFCLNRLGNSPLSKNGSYHLTVNGFEDEDHTTPVLQLPNRCFIKLIIFDYTIQINRNGKSDIKEGVSRAAKKAVLRHSLFFKSKKVVLNIDCGTWQELLALLSQYNVVISTPE